MKLISLFSLFIYFVSWKGLKYLLCCLSIVALWACVCYFKWTVNELSEKASVLHHLLTPPPPQIDWLLLLTPPLLCSSGSIHTPVSEQNSGSPEWTPSLGRRPGSWRADMLRIAAHPGTCFLVLRHLSRLLLLLWKVAVSSVCEPASVGRRSSTSCVSQKTDGQNNWPWEGLKEEAEGTEQTQED